MIRTLIKAVWGLFVFMAKCSIVLASFSAAMRLAISRIETGIDAARQSVARLDPSDRNTADSARTPTPPPWGTLTWV
jgi:hypothetical protein